MSFEDTERKAESVIGGSVPVCVRCGSVAHFIDGCCWEEVKLYLPRGQTDKQAELFSSADGWKKGELMRVTGQGTFFVLNKYFQLGEHEFKFRINGNEWRCSPFYATRGGGHTNNWMRVTQITGDGCVVRFLGWTSQSDLKPRDDEGGPRRVSALFGLNYISLNCMLKYLGKTSCSQVEVYGSWNNWTTPIELQKEYNLNDWVYVGSKIIEEGLHTYKFSIDGTFCLDIFRAVVSEGPFRNHLLDTSMPQSPFPAFKLKQAPRFEFITGLELSSRQIHGHSMDVLGEEVVVFGGVRNGQPWNGLISLRSSVASVQEFDDCPDDTPGPSAFHQTMILGHQLAVFSGSGDIVLEDYYKFCTNQRNWKRFSFKSNSSFQRQMFSSAYRKGSGRVYFFGGYFRNLDSDLETNFNDLLVLNCPIMKMITLRLRDKTPPQGRHAHSANFINFQMLVFGGRNLSSGKTQVFFFFFLIDLFDHEKLRWETLKPEGKSPCARFGHASTVVAKTLFIYSGDASDSPQSSQLLNDLWAFDLDCFIWIEVQMPKVWSQGRVFSRMCALDESLFLYGGKTEADVKSEEEKGMLVIHLSS